MTLPTTGPIATNTIDLEANKRPAAFFGGTTPDPNGMKGYPAVSATDGRSDTTKPLINTVPMMPVAIFGDDPAGNQWNNVLENDRSTTTSFLNYYGKQNAQTLYFDDGTMCAVGGCGTGEKDTITPGVKLEPFYPYMEDNMWFSVDVAAPSTSESDTDVWNSRSAVTSGLSSITSGGWGSFLNTYAVSGSIRDFTRTFTVTRAGTYTIEASVDDFGQVFVDGALVVNLPTNNQGGSTKGYKYLTAGSHTVRATYGNNSGPTGIGVRIYIPARWNVCSAGNLNGNYEVFRVYFQWKPSTTAVSNLGYERIGAPAAGKTPENLCTGSYSSIGSNIVFYNYRPNFDRTGDDKIRGNIIRVYYNASSKVVYATGQYDGWKDNDSNKTRIYLMKIQWWPPTAKNLGNIAGNGTYFKGGEGGTTGKVTINTNQIHIEYIDTMTNYMKNNPPLPSTTFTDCSKIPKVTIDPKKPNIDTDGGDNTQGKGGGCFAASSLVTMFDGSQKRIDKIKIGDYVKDGKGRKNKVAAIEITDIGNHKLHSINGGKYFVTENHLIATDKGWGAINPNRIASASEGIESPVVDFVKKNLYKLENNVILKNEAGTTEIVSIDSKTVNENTKVYNLILENDLSYIVEGYVVFSDVEQSAPTKELRMGFDSFLGKLVERAYSREKKFGSDVIRVFLEHISRHRTLYVHKKRQGRVAVLGSIYTGIAAVLFQLAWSVSQLKNKNNSINNYECDTCKIIKD